MPSFGNSSQAKLDTVDPILQMVCKEVIKYIDFSVTYGIRTTEEQQQLYAEDKTTLDGVNKKSKHQDLDGDGLSEAVDIAPYPIDFSNKISALGRFYMLAGYMFMAFEDLKADDKIPENVYLRWGGDWDSDKDLSDQTFNDLPHFELVKK